MLSAKGLGKRMDRFSRLPDEIVCHILSFLSTKEATLSSVLSNRWRNLFAFSPNLCFERKDFANQNLGIESTSSFKDFVDRVLAVSGDCSIKKSTLQCREGVDTAHFNRWICSVVNRCVLDLDIIGNSVYSLPLEVFTCKTIVKLRLRRGFEIAVVPENASLPALKTLFLACIQFSYCAFEALLCACPVVEELVMHNVECVDWKHWKWRCTISCPTLQRLTINCLRLRIFGLLDSRSITFDTPNLAYLEYYDVVPEAYPVVNLDSLVEAKFDLISDVYSNPKNLIKGLRNVQILNLSTLKTMETIYSFREAIPVFKNLFHLSITIDSNKCCRTLPLLLKNSPNLETLVVNGRLHYDEYGEEPDSVCECLSEYSCLLSCRVKVLEITSYGGTILELGQLKHFLERLSCLELVKVHSWATSEKEKLQLTMDLLNLPRSSKCKIQFQFIPSS